MLYYEFCCHADGIPYLQRLLKNTPQITVALNSHYTYSYDHKQNKVKKERFMRFIFKSSNLLFSMIIMLLMLLAGCSKKEAGWPRWRGPNGDGISTETDWDPTALTGGPKILWSVDVGLGYSNVVIKNNCLYTMGTRGVVCLNADTGEEVWKHGITTTGPAATPALDGNYLYALTERGDFLCLQANNGKLRWKKDLPSEYDVEVLPYGFATSPVVDGSLIILNLNTSGIALDKKTGEIVWASDQYNQPRKLPSPDGHYATAVLFDCSGVRCALMFSSGGLYCVEAKTGKRLWYHRFVSYAIIPDPVLSDDYVFIAGQGSAEEPCALLDIAKDPPVVLWQNDHLNTFFPTAVHHNGYLFGSKGAHYTLVQPETLLPFRCLEWATGNIMWETELHITSVTVAAGNLIILESSGTLRVAEAIPSEYSEISSCKLPSKSGIHKWWTPPVLYNGKIYCRNTAGDLLCIDVRKDS